MKITDVIRRPLITEKTSIQREDGRTIVFQVHVGANKIEIKRAVEEIFKVHVTTVNVLKVPGKMRRMGRTSGMTRSWKKAIVTLAGDERIELFQGV